MAAFDPPYINSNIFNTRYFTDLDDSLTLAAADLRYLKLSGGVVYGLTTFSNSLNVVGTLSINGSAIDLSLISGVVAGTPQASKALSLNALSQIDGNLQFAVNRKILMNNSASSGAYIDMGATASDRCISLFSDAASYYGFGAGGSQLRSFSKTDFAWYSGATQSVIGSKIMSLTSAGLLTTTSLALSGTITGITGLSLTGAISGVTTLGLSGILTSSNATASTLNSNGALVLAGGIGISNTTDATSSTNGGTFTTAGGAAIAKSLYVGTITNTTGLNVSGVSTTSTTQITTTANYSGVMDTSSIVLKQSSTTNGNKLSIDFMISTNAIDNANTATCSITHERILAYVGDLVFNTKRTANATASLTEAMRISSTGTCSIANTSSGFQLDLGGSGTGINTNALTTTSLTLGATAITASGSEINVLTGITPGTVLASSSVVVDSNKDITGFRRLSVGGTTGIMQINALTGGDAAIRLGSSEAVNKCWTIQYLTATNLLRFDAFGSNSSITLTPAGDLTSKASFDTLAYKLNGVALTMSALTGVTPGTAAASKALVLDASSNIATINNLGMSGILSMSAASTTLSMTVPSSIARSNFQWTGDTGVQWEYGMRGSSNTPANALYWYSGGHRMILFNGGQLTVGGQQTPSTQTLQVNHATGSCLRMTYNLTSNLCDMSLSSGGILTIAPSGSVTAISGTTGSTSSTTGALTLSGGIGISLTTDATSITNGGTFTTAGGIAVAKSVWCGGTVYVNKSTSSSLFTGYCGTSAFTVSGLLNSDISIGTGGITNLNLMTGNTTAMTIDGFTQAISGITSLSANFLTANSLTGTCATAAQPFITSLGVLTALSVSGTLTLGGTAITASAAELNYCDLAGSAGTAEANKVMTLDASKNIATVNRITSNYLTINTAINAASCIASFAAVNTGPIVTAYGISSIKGTVGYSSAFFGSTNSILWMEGSNASVIGAEINISSGPGSTSTNGMRIGTCTANQFSLFTNATNRLIITSTGNVGIGSNASTNDKVFGILDGTAGSTQVDLRVGNALSSNNCFTISYIPTSSGSSSNKIQFDPYGSAGALTILAKRYVGIGTTGPICPLDVSGSESGLGILAPYQYAGATSGDGGYVASGTTTGVSINARFQDNVIFDQKIYIRSDRRVKKDIVPLTVDLGIKFVEEVNPVLFRKKDQSSDAIMEIGYIAQDIMKAGFGNIITHTDNDNMKIEEEGDIENIQFNVDYSRVCSILHSVVKDQQKRINSLEDTLEDILNELREIKSNL